MGTILHAKAHLLRNLGRLEEAKELNEDAIAAHVASLGPGSPPTIAVANSVNDLAIVLMGLGDTESAFAAFSEALEIKVAVRGPAHPDTAMALVTYESTHQHATRSR